MAFHPRSQASHSSATRVGSNWISPLANDNRQMHNSLSSSSICRKSSFSYPHLIPGLSYEIVTTFCFSPPSVPTLVLIISPFLSLSSQTLLGSAQWSCILFATRLSLLSDRLIDDRRATVSLSLFCFILFISQTISAPRCVSIGR